MTQELVWEREYRKSKLLTKDNKPQADVVRFVKWLRKNSLEQRKQPLKASSGRMTGFMTYKASATTVLDLGSGTGRNSFYFDEMGCKVTGLEISKTAIEIAQKYSTSRSNLEVEYRKQSIGEKFPVEDDSIDIVLDVTSSNSLTEAERGVYLRETSRVLKSGGYFFVKALCRDGDANAKFLLKNHPGKEKDTYIMPELGITERVWNKEDFVSTYEKYFEILKIDKKTNYSRMNNRSYKRNFWIAYLRKT